MADDADAQLPRAADEDTHAIASVGSSASSEVGDDDVTVLTTSAALETGEFPQGLSPRELSITLKGQLLGHFHLQEFIGGGGMGAVFKALDTTLDRIVAVKVVASQSISSEDLQRRFLVEAQSTARLDHPNIARIHFVGRDRGLPYIVFEYIDGVNLRDLVLNHGPIPLGDALSFTTQIAHALAHAWEKEVVHRDIKPSNILITREGQAKLVDMGLARLKDLGAADDDLTNTGVTLGTFDYISPEQALDPREADTRSDIYSLGCTLFYMLSGRPPFAEGTAAQKLLQHQDQSPPNLSVVIPDIPDSVARLVRTMLAKSPDQRPQTPSELVGNCHEIFCELGIQPPATLAPQQLIPLPSNAAGWRTHLPWAIPPAGLLAIAIGWTTIDFTPSDQVEFPPPRFPIAQSSAESSRVNSPESSNLDADSAKHELVVEEIHTRSVPEGAQDGPTIQMGPIFDVPPAIANLTTQSSLLEFSASEPAPDEDASDPSEEFDVGNLLELAR